MVKTPKRRQYGSGQIEKRGDKWLIRMYLQRDGAGKKVFHNETVEGTKTEAEKRLRALQNEKDAGVFVEPTDLTLNQYLDKWLVIVQRKVAKRTHEDYSELMARYVKSELGEKRLSSLKNDDIQTLYTDMLERSLSSRTIRYTHTVLKAALKRAVKMGLLKSNPAEDVELPRKEQREMRALTPDEARKFLDAAEGDRYEALFIFALDTGMRPEEYLALKWGDIDLERGTATVRRTLCWKRKGRKEEGGGWYFGKGKTAKSRRTLPLSRPTIQAITNHRPASFDPEDFVFTTVEGGPMISDNLAQRYFKPLLKKAKLSTVRLYDLRHTMATLLLVAGVNPKIVSERLGHSSVVLTLDTYSHIIPGLQELATQKLEQALFG